MSNAGHILGSACVHVDDGNTRVVFSGDVGRPDGPVMKSPEPLKEADYLIVESTYGDRRHPDVNPKDMLEEIIKDTFKKGGVVLIPTFAVGRAQTLLYLLTQLISEKKIPR